MVFFFAYEPSTGDLARLRSATRGHLGPHHVTQPTFETGPSGPIAVSTSAGSGTSTGSFTVTTGGTSPPSAPANLTAHPSAATVSLSWTDSDPTVSYQLDRSNDPGFGTYTSVSLPAGTTSYRDTGLASAVYYYRLAAINSGGQSPYASASAATLPYATLVAGRTGLLAYWRLGESSGTTAGDTAGTYNGTYVTGPALE